MGKIYDRVKALWVTDLWRRDHHSPHTSLKLGPVHGTPQLDGETVPSQHRADRHGPAGCLQPASPSVEGAADGRTGVSLGYIRSVLHHAA